MTVHRPGDQITGITDQIRDMSEVAAGTGITLTARPNQTVTVMPMKRGAGIVIIITDQVGVKRTMSWKKDSICPERMRTNMSRSIRTADMRHRTTR